MVETPFRYESVRQAVLDMIDSGGLAAGDKAPSLRRLAARLRVSLSTVSQAYAALEAQGVLEARPKSGFYVRGPRADLPLPQAEIEPGNPPEPLHRADLIQKVLADMTRSDTLHLGVARTAESLLPTARVNRMLAQVLKTEGRRAAGYEDVAGHQGLRRQVALCVQESGIEARASEVLVTAGAMEALHVALRCVTRPGDTVLIASPTYYCFLQMLENLGLRVVEIPSRPQEGVRPAELAQAVSRFNVAACVLTPNFNNPDGSLTPDAAKAEIVDILAARHIPLVEDDVYGDLHHGPVRPMCCKAFDRAGLVLHCSSFSKTIAPGYRVGWIMPGRFFSKALEIKTTINVSSPTPTQMAIAEYLRAGHYHRHLARLRPAVKEQMRAMRALIARHFPPGARLTDPEGGTVLWVEAPGLADCVELMYRAQERGVTVAPGTLFSPTDRFRDCLRLSASVPAGPRLEEAVRDLGGIVKDMIAGVHEPLIPQATGRIQS